MLFDGCCTTVIPGLPASDFASSGRGSVSMSMSPFSIDSTLVAWSGMSRTITVWYAGLGPDHFGLATSVMWSSRTHSASW